MCLRRLQSTLYTFTITHAQSKARSRHATQGIKSTDASSSLPHHTHPAPMLSILHSIPLSIKEYSSTEHSILNQEMTMQLLDCCYTNGGDGEHANERDESRGEEKKRREENTRKNKNTSRRETNQACKGNCCDVVLCVIGFISSLRQQPWQP